MRSSVDKKERERMSLKIWGDVQMLYPKPFAAQLGQWFIN